MKQLEAKLSIAESQLKSAQDAKADISEQLSRILREKKEALAREQVARESKEAADKKLLEN